MAPRWGSAGPELTSAVGWRSSDLLIKHKEPTVQPKLGLIWFWKELKGRQVVGDRQIQSIWTQCVGKSIDPGSPSGGSFRVCCPTLGGENVMWKDLTTWSPSIVAATRFPSILPPTQRTHTTDIRKPGWILTTVWNHLATHETNKRKSPNEEVT